MALEGDIHCDVTAVATFFVERRHRNGDVTSWWRHTRAAQKSDQHKNVIFANSAKIGSHKCMNRFDVIIVWRILLAQNSTVESGEIGGIHIPVGKEWYIC